MKLEKPPRSRKICLVNYGNILGQDRFIYRIKEASQIKVNKAGVLVSHISQGTHHGIMGTSLDKVNSCEEF